LDKRKRSNKNKNRSVSEKVEDLVIRCKNIEVEKSKKKVWILHFSKKLQFLLKILPLKENVSLYLLRNNLYRILNDSIKNSDIRKLVKKEILKAPRGTFSEFKRLFSEIINELKDQTQNDFILLNNNN